MAVWRLAAAVLGAALIQGPAITTVVVIDRESTALEPEQAAELRTALLSPLDPSRTAHFVLTRATLTFVASVDAPRLVGTTFLPPPPPLISFTDSVEILRGNQAVRDTVIRQYCAAVGRSGCGPEVASVVEATVRDAERAATRRLEGLVDVARQHPGARLVLVTSGWPIRDDSRVPLSRVVRELRTLGTAVVVVRAPGAVRFQGLVRDATERLAAHLGAGFVEFADFADLEEARRLVGGRLDADARPTEPVAVESEPSPIETASPQAATTTVAPAGQATVTDRPDDTLRLASAYVARFEGVFAAMRWHERYEQTVRFERIYGASGARTVTVADHRVLEADMMLLRLPADRTWLSVRDVVAVDGRPRAPVDRRLPALAAGPTLSIPRLRELARGNGQFNIGTIVRTFNEPTLALLFLDADHRARFAFARREETRLDGRRVATYDFEELARPTVVTAGARDLPARGHVRLDAATGQVLETFLELRDTTAGLLGRMTVVYGPSARFDVLVPESMQESYVAKTGETVTAEAIYSNFRRFETAGRLVPN